MRRQPPRHGFTLVELSIVVLVISLLATVAMTEFTRFVARSKRAEVHANLRSLGRLEMMFQQDQNRFSPLVQEIGFGPERGNRFAYVLQDGCPQWQDRAGVTIGTTAGMTCIGVDTFRFTGSVPIPPTTLAEEATTSNFLGTAVGNIDNDPDVEQWSISSNGRTESAASSTLTCAGDDATAYDPCFDIADD